MTRTPLRPLARILSAREKGENPDAIERENIRLRADVRPLDMRAVNRALYVAGWLSRIAVGIVATLLLLHVGGF